MDGRSVVSAGGSRPNSRESYFSTRSQPSNFQSQYHSPSDKYCSPYSTTLSRSMFGAQIVSNKSSSPGYRFGSETRGNNPDEKRRARTPGPQEYFERSSFGSQVLGVKPSSPAYHFGGNNRFKDMVIRETSQKPGPGHYQDVSSFGRQCLSRNESGRAVSLGASHVKRAKKPSTPGPCEYPVPTSLGKQVVATRQSSASHSFGSKPRDCNVRQPKAEVPGPGAYHEQRGFGVQFVSSKNTRPAFGFGSSNRDAALKTYLGAEHDRPSGANSPGPQAYKQHSSVGRQAVAKSPSAPAFGFSRSSRFDINIGPRTGGGARTNTKTPGPGTYRV